VLGSILPAALVRLEAVVTDAAPPSVPVEAQPPAPTSTPVPSPPPIAGPQPPPLAPVSVPPPGPTPATLAGPRPPFVAPAPAPARWWLAVDDGSRIPLAPLALLGRDPTPMAAADRGAELVRLADPGLSVSKTHAAIGFGDEGAWVEDRASTNGTTVVDRHGGATRLVPGVRAHIGEGVVLVLGERRVELQLA
jgi:hypothetical protein